MLVSKYARSRDLELGVCLHWSVSLHISSVLCPFENFMYVWVVF